MIYKYIYIFFLASQRLIYKINVEKHWQNEFQRTLEV